MSDFIKQIAALFPAPVNQSRHFSMSGLDVVFPFYHAISDKSLPHLQHLYAIRNVKQFESDLDYLLKYFEAIKMSEYLDSRLLANPKKPPMVLSFDDGLIQCYDEVLPILLKKGVPATFFLNNAFIDNKAMFFRFKVSLLIEKIPFATKAELEKAAILLHCEVSEIEKRLLTVSYVEREITDQLAEAWSYSYKDYMTLNPVYLTSIHIKKMLDEGFEIGSHGIDHPMFSLLKETTTLDHVDRSVEDLKKKYKIKYKYFAFPFTDYGVQDHTIEQLFKKDIIDAGFGTAGLKEDKWPNYFQRVPMEQLGMDARRTLRGEINRRRVRRLNGSNVATRGKLD